MATDHTERNDRIDNRIGAKQECRIPAIKIDAPKRVESISNTIGECEYGHFELSASDDLVSDAVDKSSR